MQKALLEKAIFLDRDGVLNEEPGDYTWLVDRFHVLPGVLESLRIWKEQGYALIVITNQGGIDKGLYNHADVEAVHQYFQGLCIQQGFEIDDFYYCPHHNEISGKCLCRKPGSLMICTNMAFRLLNP
jgi:D-glycero-D-manno-heptose 1,7-bisphosphate phosphatase